jgi:MoaA/NifB/PqqE/SkfB family radical SAM enzyme
MPNDTVSPPYFVAWELTLRSNALCLHADNGSGTAASTAGELSALEALAVVDDLAESGVPLVGLTGGEPLLRSDWRRIASRAVRRGIAVSLATDGWLVGEEIAGELAAAGVQSVTVALDSHLPAVHDRLHQQPGLHAAAEAAIRRLAARGLRTVVSFTPTAFNWDHAEGVVERAAALGARAVALSEYVPAGRALSPLHAASSGQHRMVAAAWGALRAAWRGRLNLLGPELWATLGGALEVGTACAAARRLARIRPDGTVTPCPFLETPMGSLREESFGTIWERALGGPSPYRATPEALLPCGACRWQTGEVARGYAAAGAAWACAPSPP